MARVSPSGRPAVIALIVIGIVALLAAGAFLWRSPPAAFSPAAPRAAAPPEAPAVPPPPPWTQAQLEELLDVVAAAVKEGLQPSDYKAATLQDDVERKLAGPETRRLP